MKKIRNQSTEYRVQRTEKNRKSMVTWCALFVLILTWLLLPQARALAATYYLDIDGVGEDGILGTADDVISSDANPGTSEQPWKTLGRAYTWYSGSGSKVAEGDTVLFRNGDYGQFRESTRYNPGELWLLYRNDWVTYKAAPGHKPILTGIEINNADKWPTSAVDCDYVWTEGNNVTVDVNTVIRQQGTGSIKITVNSNHHAGDLLAYYNLPTHFNAADETCSDKVLYYLRYNYGNPVNITNITQSNPAIVSVDAWPTNPLGTDLVNGDLVRILAVGGMTQVNNRTFATIDCNKVAGTFALQDVNSINYSAYTSGGTAQRDISIAAGKFELVIDESHNGAKSGTYVKDSSDALTVDTWKLNEHFSFDQFSQCDSVASIALYANGEISAGTVIYIDYIAFAGCGDSYLKFEGFRVLNSVYVAFTSYFQVRDCNITGPVESYEGLYAPYFPFNSAGISANGCKHITIEDCDVSRTYRGISVTGANDVTIRNNVVHYFGEDGITAPAFNTIIDKNKIYDCNAYRTTIDIYGTGSGTFTRGDAITQAGTNATGIYSMKPGTQYMVYQTTGVEFRSQSAGGGTITGPTGTISDITRIDPQHTDGIAMHGNSSNVVITNNIIHPHSWNGIKLAGYAGGLVENITIANNLVYDTDDYAMYVGSDPGTGQLTYQNVNIYNNTFRSRKLHLRDWTKIQNLYNNIITRLIIDSGRNAEIVNHGNNIFIEDPGTFKNETELVTTTPGFVDPNGDFRLKENSVAINFGNPDYGPKTDILGNLRDAKPDAGCYEYGASTLLYGDVNADSEISAYDAALAARLAVGLDELTADKLKVADVNDDGEVTAYDAALIAQRAVGLIEKFPVEE